MISFWQYSKSESSVTFNTNWVVNDQCPIVNLSVGNTFTGQWAILLVGNSRVSNRMPAMGNQWLTLILGSSRVDDTGRL